MPAVADLSALFYAPHKYPLEFLTVWTSLPVQEVRARYKAADGDESLLALLLYWLWADIPKPARLPPSVRRALHRLWIAMEVVLSLKPGDVQRARLPRGWLENVRRGIHELAKALLSQGPPLSAPPRPGPLSRDSLLVAVLAFEFRWIFGKARYGYILMLARAFAPKRFPKSTETKHLQERVRSIPSDMVERYHQYCAAVPPPQNLPSPENRPPKTP